jgi:hypothetical protein
MCGGVIFPYSAEYREALEQSYSPAEIAEFERTGQVKSLFWQKGDPVLPVVAPDGADSEKTQVEVMKWGNRDKDAPFPQTGWARLDSVNGGRWGHLDPQPTLIPVSYGVEKGRWFEIEEGIQGVVVSRGGERRVYMLTDDASPEYLEATNHARMPVLEGQSHFDWLPGEPPGPGTVSAR